MTATDNFFQWFFIGINGLGGWFIFLILAAIAAIWLLYDSQTRRLPTTGWRMAVILLAALLLPALIFRFSGAETQSSLARFMEAIFYLGLLGGVLPPVLAVGYYLTFQGMAGCPNGHVYETVLGECPECAPVSPPIQQPYAQPAAFSAPQPMPEPAVHGPPPMPAKPKAHAWLVTQSGRNYQLNLDETTIGRSSRNDIQIADDTTVSNNHAKIVEQNGHFRLFDLGSTNGTLVNKKRVRGPILLEPDDEIQLGDNSILRFVTSRR